MIRVFFVFCDSDFYRPDPEGRGRGGESCLFGEKGKGQIGG